MKRPTGALFGVLAAPAWRTAVGGASFDPIPAVRRWVEDVISGRSDFPGGGGGGG